MTRSGAAAGHVGYFHETAVYDSDEEFVDIVRPFLQEGVASGEPTVISCADHNAELLRRSLDCSSILFLPGGDQYARPGPSIRSYRSMFADLVARGADQIRVVGDVPHPGIGARWDAWRRYEAAVNVAYDEFPIWGMCPYDRRTAPPEVLDDVVCTHPHIAGVDGTHRRNEAFVEPAAFLDAPGPGDDVAGRPADLELDDPTPGAARAALAQLARGRLDRTRIDDLVLVASEVVTNAVRHGRGAVGLRAWADPGRVAVTVHDEGPGPDDLFVGWRTPVSDDRGGRGLWIAHQLCADVAISRRHGCDVTFWVESPTVEVS